MIKIKVFDEYKCLGIFDFISIPQLGTKIRINVFSYEIKNIIHTPMNEWNAEIYI